MKILLVSLSITSALLLSGCTTTAVTYSPAYSTGYVTTVGYNPYVWGPAYYSNDYGIGTGWYGSQNFYGTTVYSSDW